MRVSSRRNSPRGIIASAAALALAVAAGVWWVGRDDVVLEVRGDQNVVLITIDTLRADALGAYGGRAATPNIDGLAASGVRFTFAHAHAVVTLPSHASILTGRLPYEHGIRDNSGYRLPADARTAAEFLPGELKAAVFARLERHRLAEADDPPAVDLREREARVRASDVSDRDPLHVLS